MKALRGKYEELSRQSLAVEHVEKKVTSDKALQELQEWRGLAEDYTASYEREEAENVSLKKKNGTMEAQLATLQYRVDSADGRAQALSDEIKRLKTETAAIDNLEHLPANLPEELDLAAKLWPSRICVLPKAHDSAERFPGKDYDEYWQILKAAANDLWSLYFEEGSTNIPDDFKALTGYELALTETKATNRSSTMMRQRERSYDGKTVEITAHIKGRNKNPKFAFRLYYYADEDKKLIVIGHCGGHLTTSGTQRLK